MKRKSPLAGYQSKQGILEARRFFASKGIRSENSGLLSIADTKSNLDQLVEWKQKTFPHPGILMETETDFYRKVLLAVSTWTQTGEKAPYLLGKGIGVEIALRGFIKERIKNDICFSYRSHSDFELYGVVDYNSYGYPSSNTPFPPYSEEFFRIFGGQEIFPVTRTKGLRNIPPGLMHETAEWVNLGGVMIKVPLLELLFLDKWFRRESTPRTEGYDAELLARQYRLDWGRALEYAQEFNLIPRETDYLGSVPNEADRQFEAIAREVSELRREEGMPVDLAANLNSRMATWMEIAKDRAFRVGGISTLYWFDLSSSDFGDTGELNKEPVRKKITEKVRGAVDSKLAELQDEFKQLEEFSRKVLAEYK